MARLDRILREALSTFAVQPDGGAKDIRTQRLIALAVQFRAAAAGLGDVFSGTGAWHVAHDSVLAVPELKEYRAIVRIRTTEIVRNPAERESLRATRAAARRGVLVERVLVLPDSFWPTDRLLPVADILPWIEDQQACGFRVIVVRERDLGTESRFGTDTCVFDDWAVGTRDIDDHDQTLRVALDFVPVTVRAAIERFDRASQIGIPFGVLLERAARSE